MNCLRESGSLFFLFIKFIAIAENNIIVAPKYCKKLADSPKTVSPIINTKTVEITVVSDTQERLADFKTFKTKNQFIGQIIPLSIKIKSSSVVIPVSFGIHIREHKKDTVTNITRTAISFVFLTAHFLKML